MKKLPFYFSLLGDASDNIPGVKGIGEKGATDLVKQFDSLEDMYAHLDKIVKERTRILLAEQKENAFLSYRLFLLQHYPTGMHSDALLFDARNWVNARPFFKSSILKACLRS